MPSRLMGMVDRGAMLAGFPSRLIQRVYITVKLGDTKLIATSIGSLVESPPISNARSLEDTISQAGCRSCLQIAPKK